MPCVWGTVALTTLQSHGERPLYATNPFKTIPRKQQVHLLIPGNEANSRICRTLTSALVNGYPEPTIINWGQHEGDESMNGYDMITGKNWGVLMYLRNLPSAADEDIVVMVDAHDVVFQLPMEVLLKRYAALRKQQLAQLIAQHGDAQVAKYNLAKAIFMGAEKFCWPLDHRHPACWAVPQSSLRPDAYGAETDKDTDTNRPRFLNSGTIIGPVGDLRRLYEHAHVLWTAYDSWGGGDQDYFSNIYGRQELSLQRLRNSSDWKFSFGEHYEEGDLIWPNMETKHTDYHLGVDLTSGMFQALNHALDDLSPVVHNNDTDVARRDEEHGTAETYEGTFSFPTDLQSVPMPLRGPNGDFNWKDVRLFSNFHARTIPAILHYNGDKTRMDEWWQRQWWTGQGRYLMEKRMNGGNFTVKTDSTESPRLEWEDICGSFDEQLYVDQVETWE